MGLTRRSFGVGLGAGLLSACSGGLPAGPVATPGMRPVANAGYDAWVAGFRGRAAARGIAPEVVARAFRGAGYLPGVVERDRNQTEFTRTLEDYLAIAASDERVGTGREMYRRHGALLSRIEARYGVESRVVCAIWGLESRYGARRGDVPVISALSTLAYDGRRGSFFESQLIAALKILQNGDIPPAQMTGSWAGAMGHTQFIPTSYLAYAVDFDGDGRRDIWSADPGDALASAAAYLSRSGWRHGQPWGLEVALPSGFAAGLTGRGQARSVAAWQALGVRPAAGGRLPDHGTAAVLAPAGTAAPAFLVFQNFWVILRYNNSEKYGLGIGHLSDRIAGGGPIVGRFPPDANGLTLADRKEIQSRLMRRGYDTGGADGVIGSKTEAAIGAYQRRAGVTVTGKPSVALLRQLRG
ncbi:lytic murein transglycosylase [Pseudodonghicola flavimaris]|uniref:Lytic murein transglycosylase n=1 Tax=Pseudodonghicola flavimaris TaxID=3050036 RepID=A0ABT7EXL8_9RHOB|nr:lytic murein transglycosylase [Pseudodonghicola flavimaris]MDK3017024.1 lytic murein transglycosylase [Pseudodonghicola flavimaris]